MTTMLWGLAAAVLALWAPPAGAQQVAPPAPSPNHPLILDLSPPADSGKPRYFAPHDLPPSPGCATVLNCRLKVIGALQHNGAVELNGALFKW
ncbi:MAG TPA: hypothetical protein VN808_20750 [Stellaceae bacterium]|nr:hypothetical protein [Stellaceae bacterium]